MNLTLMPVDAKKKNSGGRNPEGFIASYGIDGRLITDQMLHNLLSAMLDRATAGVCRIKTPPLPGMCSLTRVIHPRRPLSCLLLWRVFHTRHHAANRSGSDNILCIRIAI